VKIIKKSYAWNGTLSPRSETGHIILHHAAAIKCSADDIHRIHISNGWTGIGYHFYIRKDGSVYEGRPIAAKGAHTEGFNSKSIGICFEGNFEKEKMPIEQMNAGRELVLYLKRLYPFATVGKHSDFNSTVCPGKNFPFDEVSSGITLFKNVADIVEELEKRGIMTNIPLWKSKCSTDANAYNLAEKICNKTKMSEKRKPSLESINDVVWELWHRGIIEERNLWLSLMEKDKDLYWLGFKAANYTEMR